MISAIVVTPQGRGSGAGRTLTEVFLTAARAADSRIAMLVNRADNTAAAAFWDRLGWSQVETHRNLSTATRSAPSPTLWPEPRRASGSGLGSA